MEGLIVAFIALFAYRLPHPHIGGYVVADVAEIAFAAYFVTFGARYLVVGARVWIAAVLCSQFGAVLLSLPTSISLGRTTVEIIHTGARAIVIVGISSWLSQADTKARIGFVIEALIALSVLVGLQALVYHGGNSSASLYAPIAGGSVVRLGGVAGGFLPGMVLVGFAFCLARLLMERRQRFASACCAVFLLVVVVLTYTRGAYFDAFAVSLVAAVLSAHPFRRSKRIAFSLLVLASLALGVLIADPVVVARFSQFWNNPGGSTVHTRMQLWVAALHLWRSNPLLGTGAGTFNKALNLLYTGRLPVPFYTIFTYPEQQLLGLMSETGILGLLSYLGGMIWVTARCIGRERPRPLFRVAVGTVMATRLLSEVAGTWFSGNEWLSIAVALGVVVAFADWDTNHAPVGEEANYRGQLPPLYRPARLEKPAVVLDSHYRP